MNTNSPKGLTATYGRKLKGEGPRSAQPSRFLVTFRHYRHPLVAASSCQPPPNPLAGSSAAIDKDAFSMPLSQIKRGSL